MNIKAVVLLVAVLLSWPATAQDATEGHAHHDHIAMDAAPVDAEGSLYALDREWTDQAGRTLRLADLAGSPSIVVLFYGNCTTACPILLHDATRLEAALPEAVRARTNVLAVSFDTATDTPEVLAEYARTRGLDDDRWRFLHADRAQVRELAMLLGVRYRDNGDGSFSHTNLITVLDGEGRIIHRVEGLVRPMDDAAARLTAATRSLEK